MQGSKTHNKRQTRPGTAALRRGLGLLLAAIGIQMAIAANASALGQIEYGGCISDNGSGGLCADAPGAPLDGATPVVGSPDGKQVYVAGGTSDSVAVFDRAPAGQLTYAGCVSRDGSGGLCADVPADVLDVPTAVTLSPDGSSLYVTSLQSRAILEFDRAPGGQITFAGCVSDDGSGGDCSVLPGNPLILPTALAVSPDGSTVYAAANETVSVYDRAADGSLGYAGCVSSTGSGGLCADPPGQPLNSLDAIGIDPSGSSVYAGSNSGTVSQFVRAPGGQITFAGCVSNDGSGGLCADVPGAPMDALSEIALSPDGRQLYVTAFLSDAVTVLDRAPGGQITFAGCVSDDGSGGACADPPGPLTKPVDARVSPDGGNVYVTSSDGDAVTVLNRAAGGQVTYAGCVSDTGTGGLCADLPGQPLDNPLGIEVSPDGNSVYVAGEVSDSVTHLFRKAAPETTIDSGPADGRKVADATPTFAFSANQEGATFECAIDGAAFAPCTSPVQTQPLIDGAHSFAVRATTAGDTDATPAQRAFTVDTQGPAVRLRGRRNRVVRETRGPARVRFAFTSPEAGARFECRIDRGRFRPCRSPRSVRIARGRHRFSVRAVDALGNRGPAASARVRVVRRRGR